LVLVAFSGEIYLRGLQMARLSEILGRVIYYYVIIWRNFELVHGDVVVRIRPLHFLLDALEYLASESAKVHQTPEIERERH